MANLPNIDYKSPKRNPTIDSPTSEFEIPLYKDVEYFGSLENFVSFVKAVEQLVRRSDDYTRYKRHLFEDVGLTYCQVLSNIDEKNMVAEDDGKKQKKRSSLLEMHHGPIFTLFDYAQILTEWMIVNDKKITTFRVADLLLQEHFDNRVQTVMLSKTIHEQVHEGSIFINLKQAFGDLNGFIDRYSAGLSVPMIEKVNRYIEKSIKHDSFDNGVLELNYRVKDWSKMYNR